MATYIISTSGNSLQITEDNNVSYSYLAEDFVTQTESNVVHLYSKIPRNIRYQLKVGIDTIEVNGKTSFVDGNDLKQTLDNAIFASDVYLYNTIDVLDFQADAANVDLLVSAFRFESSSDYKKIEKIFLNLQAQTNDKYNYKLVSNPVVNGTPLVFNQLEDSNIEFALGGGGGDNQLTSYDNILYAGNCDHRATENVTVDLNVQSQNPTIGLIVRPMSAGLDIFCGINIAQNL